MANEKIGFALTGSFCTFEKALKQMPHITSAPMQGELSFSKKMTEGLPQKTLKL